MAGFLFNLFEAKWSKFGWYMHIVIRSLDAAVVATAMYISLSIKGESYGEKQTYGAPTPGEIFESRIKRDTYENAMHKRCFNRALSNMTQCLLHFQTRC